MKSEMQILLFTWWSGNSSIATHRNTDAVDYEQSCTHSQVIVVSRMGVSPWVKQLTCTPYMSSRTTLYYYLYYSKSGYILLLLVIINIYYKVLLIMYHHNMIIIITIIIIKKCHKFLWMTHAKTWCTMCRTSCIVCL